MLEKIESENLFGEIANVGFKIDREQLKWFIFDNIKDMTLEELVLCFTNKYRAIVEYLDLLEGKNTSQRTSLLFNPHRLNTATKRSKSVFGALKSENFASGLARATIWQKDAVSDVFYTLLQAGVNGITYVNEFTPSIARDLLKKFSQNENSKILDPCAGWGGRMIGISCISNNYTAYEPSTRTYNGLIKLAKFLVSFNADFSANIVCEPFEDVELPNNYYDFALTSPPYYDTERYSDEETNSLNRYSSFDEWVGKFYIVLIDKTMDALKNGGFFVLNIGSRVYPLNSILLDNFANKFKIQKLSGHYFTTKGLGKGGEGETLYSIKKA